MRRHLLLAGLCGATLQAVAAPDLTEIEARWMRAAVPVLEYAKERQLPIDIVVQPQNTPGLSPLSIGWVEGRCKLVVSMRGNPQAQAPVSDVAPELFDVVVESIVAHEVGHCWRYLKGTWNALPAAGDDPHSEADLARLRREMHATRREEAFADLVGLAWTQRRHPQRYAQVYSWLMWQRRHPMQAPGAHHDTRSWLRLAEDGAVFDATQDLFEQALGVWQKALGAGQ